MSDSMPVSLRPLDLNPFVSAANNSVKTPESSTGFSSVLEQMINRVNNAQQTSTEISKQFQLGNPNIGLEETMIAMNKSSLSLQTLVQVRNRVSQAYSEIMNMTI